MENKRNPKISTLDELRLIYHEIVTGSSLDGSTSCFIKHFSERESHLVLRKRVELFDYYVKEGVPHQDELLKNAIANGDWSKEKEDKILELKYAISDNEKNIHNIIVQQRGGIERIIELKKKELSEIVWERKQILGRHVEDLLDEDVNDYISFLSFFKDEKCSVGLASSYDEFQKKEFDEANALSEALGAHYSRISDEKIRQIACMPFFLNKLSHCKDNIFAFLGKPISELTHNQASIISLGARNLSILSQSEGSPPDMSLEALPQDILKWYDIQHSILIGKRKESKNV